MADFDIGSLTYAQAYEGAVAALADPTDEQQQQAVAGWLDEIAFEIGLLQNVLEGNVTYGYDFEQEDWFFQLSEQGAELAESLGAED